MSGKRGKADATKPSAGGFTPPVTVSHAALLEDGGDTHFRQTLYLMVMALDRLLACRHAFGRSANLSGSQFAVLIGTAYMQGDKGVTIGRLAEHVQLAATHVTTEVGRMSRRGLMLKMRNPQDRRSVLVRLTERGEKSVEDLAPYMRKVNDLLFEGVSRRQFAELEKFLLRFARQSEQALEEIRRHEQQG